MQLVRRDGLPLLTEQKAESMEIYNLGFRQFLTVFWRFEVRMCHFLI